MIHVINIELIGKYLLTNDVKKFKKLDDFFGGNKLSLSPRIMQYLSRMINRNSLSTFSSPCSLPYLPTYFRTVDLDS